MVSDNQANRWDDISDTVIKETHLVELMKANSKSINRLQKYQAHSIKLANPLAGTPNQFHFHSLHDYDETTNDGALRAMVEEHVNMGILERVPGDIYGRIPNRVQR